MYEVPKDSGTGTIVHSTDCRWVGPQRRLRELAVEDVEVRRTLTAAVQDEVGARGEARQLRRQEEAGLGHVGRLAEAPGGDGARHPLHRRRVAVEVLDLGCPHEPGGHAVDP